MKKTVTALSLFAVSTTAVPLAVAAAVLPSSILGPATTAPSAGTPTTTVLDIRAAAVCPGLSWAVLAAIASVESADGSSTLPGVRSGHNSAGAEGPMQFEPATFAVYDHPCRPAAPTLRAPTTRLMPTYAAARMLCADGGATPAGLAGAL